MRSLLLAAVVLAAPAHSAPAQSVPPPRPAAVQPGDIQLGRCLAQSTGSTPGLVHVQGCYQSAQVRIDSALDRERLAAHAKLKASRLSPATLDAGEAAWRTYRDKWCAFEAAAEHDPGSRSVTGLQCRVELSQAHLSRLRGAL
jgi:uncharacterized protein YecT (DUF1311 family)